MNTLKASFKFLCFTLSCLALVPLQILLISLHKGPAAYIIPHLWHNLICHSFNIRVVIRGKPLKECRIVYVGNHLSYLDIPVIGSCLKASFVAKADVESWPVFGFLSKLQQTAFIKRERSAARQAAGSINAYLQDGKRLIIFPEGTSTDGCTVVPFKSSLFSMLTSDQAADLVIQPFTLVMTQVDGKDATTQEIRDLYSWHLHMDTPLPQHLWRFAKGAGAVITMHFHEPVPASARGDRKELAALCEKIVREGLESSSETLKVA